MPTTPNTAHPSFGLTIEGIRKGISKFRNRVLGRVFQELGLIGHWGSGIQRMTAACHDRGLAAPEFEEIGTYFRVTLSAIRRRAPAKDERDQAILDALAASSELTSHLPHRGANRAISTRYPHASRLPRRAAWPQPNEAGTRLVGTDTSLPHSPSVGKSADVARKSACATVCASESPAPPQKILAGCEDLMQV